LSLYFRRLRVWRRWKRGSLNTPCTNRPIWIINIIIYKRTYPARTKWAIDAPLFSLPLPPYAFFDTPSQRYTANIASSQFSKVTAKNFNIRHNSLKFLQFFKPKTHKNLILTQKPTKPVQSAEPKSDFI